MHEPVSDGGGHGSGIEDISPVSERQVSRQHGRLLFMPVADYLEEEV